MSDTELSRAAARVQAALTGRGYRGQVCELPGSTRTAREAAAALGCEVAQIAKSLVFRAQPSGRAILVIASGSNQVDTVKLAQLCAESIERADAEFVRAATGFAIGGIPPLGHAQPLMTFIDEDLLALPEIWAAAGTPHAVFALTAAELIEYTNGRVVVVKADPSRS